jgi:hypothetical protein
MLTQWLEPLINRPFVNPLMPDVFDYIHSNGINFGNIYTIKKGHKKGEKAGGTFEAPPVLRQLFYSTGHASVYQTFSFDKA